MIKRMMESLKAWIMRSNETMIELILGILLVNLCIAIPGSLITGEALKFCLGELLGTAYAVFAVIHMTDTIENGLDMSEEASAKYARRGYAVRMAVSILVIIIGLRVKIFHFVAVFLGMMSVKFSVWVQPLVHKLTAKYLNMNKGR